MGPNRRRYRPVEFDLEFDPDELDLDDLDGHDLAMVDRIADTLARAGLPRPDRLTVLQVAMETLRYKFRGKSTADVALWLAERERARREASISRVH